jgi:type I restriction enzyme S subunit
MKEINGKWAVVPLGATVEEFKGGASLTAEDFTDSGFPVLHKGTIQLGGRLDFARDGKVHTSDEFVKAHQNAVVDDRFVVATLRNLVRTGETLGFVAPVPKGQSYLLAQGAYGLRLNPSKLHPRYLAHLSNDWTFHKEVLRRMVGTTQVHIRNGDFLAVEIPLPPLAEQQRIAEVLDRAEGLRAKRRAALAQLDSLTQSLFLDLFGDPATNLKGWPKQKLEELCSVDSPLIDPTREEYRNLLHYGPDRIERDTGGLLPAMTAEQDGLISAKFLFDESAVLYSKIRPNLNKVALAKERALCSADVYPVEVKRDKLSREFLWCLLRGKHFLSYTAEFSNRANIPKINREQFLAYIAICPPISLQREFACRVTAVEKLKTAQRASLAELDALFATLQHRAFKGELWS